MQEYRSTKISSTRLRDKIENTLRVKPKHLSEQEKHRAELALEQNTSRKINWLHHISISAETEPFRPPNYSHEKSKWGLKKE